MALARRPRGTLERDIRGVLAASGEPMTPAQVRDALGDDLAYTTVMTVLARMHDKAEVTRTTVGRGYAYAIEDAAAVTAHRMQRLLAGQGADRAAVLARFVGALEPGDEDVLRTLLVDQEDRP
ncbi:MAG TPA: BlaI/MecI/CopY family transcriptional regulator [Pseudonocardiaceae bacterium]|jgi:predicted transcriptional regulator|nr:BlaI/MecI/CopY family transcriptional regulator [Pseudonocardiaceae bacterium]